MKFRLLSDLHLEFRKESVHKIIKKVKEFNVQTPVDYLILAGDITNFKNISLLENFIKSVYDNYKKVFYILGNHEYYGSTKDINAMNVYRNTINTLNEKCNDSIVLLENEKYDITENFSIFGSTLWTDMSLDDYRSINDRNIFRLDEITGAHIIAKNALRQLPASREYLIITHHMPSISLVHKKYAHYGFSGFASDCEDTFSDNMIYWCYGHTHMPGKSVIKGINFISNPMGYPGENPEYNDCTFEIN